MVLCILSLMASAAYLILLSAKVNPDYLLGSNVKFSWVIWCFFMLAISMAYLLKRIPQTAWTLPLLVCFVVSVTVADGGVYAEYNMVPQYSIQTVKALDEDIILQAQEAEKAGRQSVEILVPQSESEEWPLNLSWGGERIARSLYRHGLTSTKLEIQLVMNPAVNQVFGLPTEQ